MTAETVFPRITKISMVPNACTLVPTVFRWHEKMEFKYHQHFSFSHDIEKQVWILLFVFRFRLTLKNGFELRISFFVFASLWKTDMNFVFTSFWKKDMNFVFRFRRIEFCFRFSLDFEKRLWTSYFVSRFLITLKNRSEFRLSFMHDLKNGSLDQYSHLKPRPPPQGWPGHSLFT